MSTKTERIVEGIRRQLWRMRVSTWARKQEGRRCIWRGRRTVYVTGNLVIRVKTLSQWGKAYV